MMRRSSTSKAWYYTKRNHDIIPMFLLHNHRDVVHCDITTLSHCHRHVIVRPHDHSDVVPVTQSCTVKLRTCHTTTVTLCSGHTIIVKEFYFVTKIIVALPQSHRDRDVMILSHVHCDDIVFLSHKSSSSPLAHKLLTVAYHPRCTEATTYCMKQRWTFISKITVKLDIS